MYEGRLGWESVEWSGITLGRLEAAFEAAARSRLLIRRAIMGPLWGW